MIESRSPAKAEQLGFFAAGRTLPPADEMYRAMVERDTRYDGIFFTAVKTTGIFCRPSCPA